MKPRFNWHKYDPIKDGSLLDSEFDDYDLHVIDYIIKNCQYLQPGYDFDGNDEQPISTPWEWRH